VLHSCAGRALARSLDALGEELDASYALRLNARAQQALQPPTGPAAGVEQQPAAGQRSGRQLEHGAREFLTDLRIAVVSEIPRAPLATIGAIARIDPGDALLLVVPTRLRPMHVLFLTHYFPPEIGAAPARIAALAHGLAERGLQVSVHTGFPHYPSGTIESPYENRAVLVEHEGPVRIIRSVVYPTPNRGFHRRLANHTAFAAGALATARTAGAVDVVVAESPPLFTAAAGVAYAAAKNAALALNVSDLWPESAIELGALSAGRVPAAAAHALARHCYRRAQLITAPTAGIVSSLSARAEAAGKVTLVAPAVDLARFCAIAERPRQPHAPLRVVYAGTLGLAQGLGVLVDAAALAGADVVEVQIAGDGPEANMLRDRVAEQHLSNVRLLGPVAPQDVPALLEQADAGVVPLLDRPVFRGALPTKLFELMAAGRPAIVAARGEAAELVTRTSAGLAVAPENPAALAAAFLRLRDAPAQARAMGAHGRAAAHGFDRLAAVDRWAELLNGLNARRCARAPASRRRGD
jgi:colanic acid biosynthesis glycosyl transferase WcaI